MSILLADERWDSVVSFWPGGVLRQKRKANAKRLVAVTNIDGLVEFGRSAFSGNSHIRSAFQDFDDWNVNEDIGDRENWHRVSLPTLDDDKNPTASNCSPNNSKDDCEHQHKKFVWQAAAGAVSKFSIMMKLTRCERKSKNPSKRNKYDEDEEDIFRRGKSIGHLKRMTMGKVESQLSEDGNLFSKSLSSSKSGHLDSSDSKSKLKDLANIDVWRARERGKRKTNIGDIDGKVLGLLDRVIDVVAENVVSPLDKTADLKIVTNEIMSYSSFDSTFGGYDMATMFLGLKLPPPLPALTNTVTSFSESLLEKCKNELATSWIKYDKAMEVSESLAKTEPFFMSESAPSVNSLSGIDFTSDKWRALELSIRAILGPTTFKLPKTLNKNEIIWQLVSAMGFHQAVCQSFLKLFESTDHVNDTILELQKRLQCLQTGDIFGYSMKDFSSRRDFDEWTSRQCGITTRHMGKMYFLQSVRDKTFRGTVFITIVDGKDLRLKDDVKKTVEPYVVLIGRSGLEALYSWKTKYVSSRCPSWEQQTSFSIYNPDISLELKVYSHSSFGSDDLIGHCVIDLNNDFYFDEQIHELHVKLAPKDKLPHLTENILGTVHLRVKISYSRALQVCSFGQIKEASNNSTNSDVLSVLEFRTKANHIDFYRFVRNTIQSSYEEGGGMAGCCNLKFVLDIYCDRYLMSSILRLTSDIEILNEALSGIKTSSHYSEATVLSQLWCVINVLFEELTQNGSHSVKEAESVINSSNRTRRCLKSCLLKYMPFIFHSKQLSEDYGNIMSMLILVLRFVDKLEHAVSSPISIVGTDVRHDFAAVFGDVIYQIACGRYSSQYMMAISLAKINIENHRLLGGWIENDKATIDGAKLLVSSPPSVLSELLKKVVALSLLCSLIPNDLQMVADSQGHILLNSDDLTVDNSIYSNVRNILVNLFWNDFQEVLRSVTIASDDECRDNAIGLGSDGSASWGGINCRMIQLYSEVSRLHRSGWLSKYITDNSVGIDHYGLVNLFTPVIRGFIIARMAHVRILVIEDLLIDDFCSTKIFLQMSQSAAIMQWRLRCEIERILGLDCLIGECLLALTNGCVDSIQGYVNGVVDRYFSSGKPGPLENTIIFILSSLQNVCNFISSTLRSLLVPSKLSSMFKQLIIDKINQISIECRNVISIVIAWYLRSLESELKIKVETVCVAALKDASLVSAVGDLRKFIYNHLDQLSSRVSKDVFKLIQCGAGGLLDLIGDTVVDILAPWPSSDDFRNATTNTLIETDPNDKNIRCTVVEVRGLPHISAVNAQQQRKQRIPRSVKRSMFSCCSGDKDGGAAKSNNLPKKRITDMPMTAFSSSVLDPLPKPVCDIIMGPLSWTTLPFCTTETNVTWSLSPDSIFSFPIVYRQNRWVLPSQKIVFRVWDDNTETTIGSVDLPVDRLMKGECIDEWIPLTPSNAGDIHVQCYFPGPHKAVEQQMFLESLLEIKDNDRPEPFLKKKKITGGPICSTITGAKSVYSLLQICVEACNHPNHTLNVSDLLNNNHSYSMIRLERFLAAWSAPLTWLVNSFREIRSFRGTCDTESVEMCDLLRLLSRYKTDKEAGDIISSALTKAEEFQQRGYFMQITSFSNEQKQLPQGRWDVTPEIFSNPLFL